MIAVNPWEGVTVWHELMSLNPEQARGFYEEVIGLKAAPLDGRLVFRVTLYWYLTNLEKIWK